MSSTGAEATLTSGDVIGRVTNQAELYFILLLNVICRCGNLFLVSNVLKIIH